MKKEHFVRPDVRQLLDFLDNLPAPRATRSGRKGRGR